jgi:hypothetical protein
MKVARPRVILFGVFDFNLNAANCRKTTVRTVAWDSWSSLIFPSAAYHRERCRRTREKGATP